MGSLRVICKNCGELGEDATKFLDIEEDIEGRDVMTFICDKCKTQQKSLVYSKH